MSKKRDRIIYRNKDEKGLDKRLGASRAHQDDNTQQEAVDAAKETLRNQGGGELIIKERKSKIRSMDTISPGNDPFPPRDNEY